MKISAILASLPSNNLGMISVNQAFRDWAQQYSVDMEVTRFEFGSRYHPRTLTDCCIPHELLGSLEKALRADRVIFWGDWLHMANYHRALIPWMQNQKPDLTKQEALETISDHLLLSSSAPEDINKAVLVGGTLSLNSAQDYTQDDYVQPLTKLLSEARAVLMRDPYSTTIAAYYRGNEQAVAGCDCALFLDGESAMGMSTNIASDKWKKRRAVIFLGRNASHKYVTRFALNLCKDKGVLPTWLQWLPVKNSLASSRRFKIFHRWRFGEFSTEQPSLGEALRMIASCEFTITDTYHLAINSWNLGTPAICIADTNEDVEWSMNSGARHSWRDKRYEFYSSAEALSFFVHVDELSFRSRRLARRRQLQEVVSEPSMEMEAVIHRIDHMREYVDKHLGEALVE